MKLLAGALKSLLFVTLLSGVGKADNLDCSVILLGKNLVTVDGNSRRIKDPEARGFFKFTIDTSLSEPTLTYVHRSSCVSDKQVPGVIARGQVCLIVTSGFKQIPAYGLAPEKDSYLTQDEHAVTITAQTQTAKKGKGSALSYETNESSTEVSLPVNQLRTLLSVDSGNVRALTITCSKRD